MRYTFEDFYPNAEVGYDCSWARKTDRYDVCIICKNKTSWCSLDAKAYLCCSLCAEEYENSVDIMESFN